jgi:heptose I phosphotransferase
VLELNPHLREQAPSESTFEWCLNLTGKVYRKVKHRRTLEVQFGERRYFIKIHRGCGWKEIFKDLFSGRAPIISARSEWQAIDRLHELNVPTMAIAGRGERGSNPAARESFIITEALENMVSLEDLAQHWGGLEGGRRWQLRQVLLEKIALIARTMHGHGMNHRDFYICHFLTRQRDWEAWQRGEEVTLHVIDLHRVQMRDRVPRRWLIKDLGALFYSAMDSGMTRKDLLRFVRLYEGLPWRKLSRSRQRLWMQTVRYANKLYRGWHRREPPVFEGLG